MKMSTCGVLLLLLFSSHLNALRPEELVVVVISQGDTYHSGLAQYLRTSLHQQSSASGEKGPIVQLTHENFPHPGAWTVIPILPTLYKTVGSNSSWIIFCEERTRFHLKKLVSALSQHDPTQEIWLGHELSDLEPSIIHHYKFSHQRLKFPLLVAGFAISAALLKRLARIPAESPISGFSIDAMYELATVVNSPLLNLPSVFCLENNHTDCATYPMPFVPCGEPVPNEDIYFAVKTCLKFHKLRVPVVKKTWAKEAVNVEFFSDVKDNSIPTTLVGVNTDFGHCGKTQAILKLMVERAKMLPNLQWLVLADDDTLLSVPRLRQLLSCWSGEAVVVGERYGYKVFTPDGYNYPTGGGGMAISMAVLPTLARELRCSADNSPDDMSIGILLKNGIPLIHSPFFHQARPMDYPAEYLATQLPVSFHKHIYLDPVLVYKHWLASQPKSPPAMHTEL